MTTLDDGTHGSERIFGNTATLVASRVGVAAFGWAGTLLIVRTLSVDAFGRFTLIFGVLSLMAVVTDMGTGRIAIAGVADEQRDRARFAGSYITLRITLGFVGYLVAIIVVWVAGYPPDVLRVTAVAGIVILIATPSNAIELAFQVRSNFRPVAVGNVVAQIAQFALTAAIAASGRGSLLVFTLPAIAFEIVSIVWKLRGMRGLIPVQLCIDLAAWREMLREAAPLAVAAALGTAYYNVDTVMLSKLDTFAAVGAYGVAYKFIGVAHFVPIAVQQAVMYPMVRQWTTDRAAFRTTVHRAFVLLMLAGLLLVAEIGVFAADALALLYGAEYRASGAAAGWVMGGEIFVFFTVLFYSALIAIGRRLVHAVAAGVGVVTNVALNLWLIPALSFDGAAIATLLTNATVCAILWWALLHTEGARPLGLWRPMAAVPIAGVSAAAGLLLERLIPWPIAAGAVAGMFIVGVHVFRVPGPRGLHDVIGGP